MVCTVRVTLGCGKHDDRVVRENAYDRTTQSSSLYQGISAGVEAGFGTDSAHSRGSPLLVRSPSCVQCACLVWLYLFPLACLTLLIQLVPECGSKEH